MADPYPPTVQRAALLKLVEALGCRGNALKRDECGDWRINGNHGHIYAVHGIPCMEKTEGFQIYFRGAGGFEEPARSQAWTWAKRALGFCRVDQDGDTEGLLFLDRLPTPAEAEIIRDKLRIPKRAEYGDEELARRREWASTANERSRLKLESRGSGDG